jgi:hypothetical protein
MENEKANGKTSTILLIWLTVVLVMLAFLVSGGTSASTKPDDEAAMSGKPDDGRKIVIRSKSGGKVVVSKAELSRRPGKAGGEARPSRRALPTDVEPAPTVLRLYFPTLVYPGDEVSGRLKFNDPDDYVFSIFITVFFPDGDVVTESLYDYRIDGGDIWKGTYNFWVEMPESETPLTGRIVITCSDEYLNVSEVSQNFALWY